MSGPERTEPRSPLFHPIFLGALAVLAVNDHLLKAAFPGLITGKLSDVAALIVIPPIALELARVAAGRRWSRAARRPVAVAAGLLVALALVAVKLDSLANAWYAIALGLVQWPVAALVAVGQGFPFGEPLPTPTVMDPSDLIALPAAGIGAWIAAGSWPAGTGWYGAAGRVGRVALAAAAVVILAATSQAAPSVITTVHRDEVVMSPGDPPIHRRRTVEIQVTPGTAATMVTIDIEARARWPRVEPPARFVLSRVGSSGELEPSAGSTLSIEPDTCRATCTVELDVAIDWSDAAGRPRSSIAWEIAVTARATDGYLQGWIDVRGEPSLVTADPGSGVLLGLLALVPFGGLAVGGRRRVRSRAATGAISRADRIVVGAAVLLVGALAALPLVVSPVALEPAAGRVGAFAVGLGPAIAIAVAFGLARWWSGSGDLLAVVVLGAVLIGLLFGARLIGQTPETFTARALQVAVGATILATVVIIGAVSRPDPPDPLKTAATEPASDGRIAVAGVLVALTIGLLAAAPPLGLLMGVGAGTWWWSGRGHVLGVVCFVTGAALVGMLAIGGPALFGSGWTAFEEASILLGALATFTGFMAALGMVGRHPARPVGGASTGLGPAEADPTAD